MSTAIAMKRLTLLSHLTFRMNDFTCWKWFVCVYSSRQSAWTDDKFHRTTCSVASFGTFVSRTLPYTAYRCTVFFLFFQQFSDSFICRSNERMAKCKSVNLLFFSPSSSCCSNRKRVQLNMFSLSSLISRIQKSVIRSCLQYPISFSPYGKSVAHLFQTIIW